MQSHEYNATIHSLYCEINNQGRIQMDSTQLVNGECYFYQKTTTEDLQK